MSFTTRSGDDSCDAAQDAVDAADCPSARGSRHRSRRRAVRRPGPRDTPPARSTNSSRKPPQLVCVSKNGCPLSAGSKSQTNNSSDGAAQPGAGVPPSSAPTARRTVGSTTARMRSRRFMSRASRSARVAAQLHCAIRRARDHNAGKSCGKYLCGLIPVPTAASAR